VAPQLALITVVTVIAESPPDGLHRAAYVGDLANLLAEISNGADVNARSTHDWTPLHWAAIGGNAEAARILLERGANPDAPAEFDLTPLHWAAIRGHDRVIEVMTSRGAKPDPKSLYGMTPLHLVSTKAVVDVLLDAGAKIDQRDDLGLTPLFTSRTKEAGQALMARGAEIHTRARDGRTLFDMLVVNTMEDSHGVILYGRRSSARLRGDETTISLRVLNVWPIDREKVQIHVETNGARATDPPLLQRLRPGQMATMSFELRRQPDRPEGTYPLAAQVTLKGEALGVFKLDLDTSRSETPGDRGFSRLGGAQLRRTASQHYQLLLLAAPVLVVIGWLWARRGRPRAPHSR
jgi:ankyrin repeat protein